MIFFIYRIVKAGGFIPHPFIHQFRGLLSQFKPPGRFRALSQDGCHGGQAPFLFDHHQGEIQALQFIGDILFVNIEVALGRDLENRIIPIPDIFNDPIGAPFKGPVLVGITIFNKPFRIFRPRSIGIRQELPVLAHFVNLQVYPAEKGGRGG